MEDHVKAIAKATWNDYRNLLAYRDEVGDDEVLALDHKTLFIASVITAGFAHLAETYSKETQKI